MMKKIFKFNNKGPAQYRRHKSSGSGFVILFAVTISSIILAIALGVADIAFKEINFSTSAKETNDAFFAADAGTEFVLFKDKTSTNYPMPDAGSSYWTETIPSINGVSGGSCAIVTITKDNTTTNPITTIISKGYNVGDNLCTSNNQNRVEREVKVSY